MKAKLYLFIALFCPWFSQVHGQRAMFAGHNNYVAPVAVFEAPAIVTNGLLLNLDAANPASYTGSGTTWRDLSGYNNHATLISGASYDATTGSIVTNGTSQYITVPIFNTSITNITMQTWVYINANTKGAFMSNGGNDGYSIGIGNAELGVNGNTPIMLFQAIRYIDAAPITYPTGWHLITMTLNASGIPSFYVDGTFGNSFPGSNPRTPVTSSFNLGAVPADGGKFYNGKFAAAYFYNRVLSTTEILQNYNAVKSRFGY